MARVVLDGMFVNLVEDAEQFFRLIAAGTLERVPGVPGRFVPTAGGRVRLIRQAGKRGSWRVTFPACSPESAEWLASQAGKLVCIRHPWGPKVFGAYLEPALTYVPNAAGDVDVALDLTELTYSEEM